MTRTSVVRRWPLHPRPAPGQALSSWLITVAWLHGLDLEDLLRHNLGPASYDVRERAAAATLDWNPPAGVLAALAERTGVAVHDVARLTLAGWTPWLLDTFDVPPDPVEDAAVFTTYAQQDSVLLGPGQAQARHLPGWRPWLPAAPLRRGCPVCLTQMGQAVPLMTHLPLMTSCPQHGCHLEPFFGRASTWYGWSSADVEPRTAPAHVAAMDRLTHEGLSTGMVTVPGRPGRPVHVGAWLRLLRTLIDELATATSRLRAGPARAVKAVWAATGCPRSAGGPWHRHYEALTWPRQQAMLEAAATAVHLIGTGDVSAYGTLAPLLSSPTYPPVTDGDPPARSTTLWRQARALLEEAIATARVDPVRARQLQRLTSTAAQGPAAFARARQTLMDAGVPGDFLRTYAELHTNTVDGDGRPSTVLP